MLVHQKINRLPPWTCERVPAKIAKGSQRLWRKGARIEPMIRRPDRGSRRNSDRGSSRPERAARGDSASRIVAGAGDQVWTISKVRSRCLVLGTIGRVFNGKRNTG